MRKTALVAFVVLLAACNTGTNGNPPADSTVNDLHIDPGGKVNDTGTPGNLNPPANTQVETDSLPEANR